MVSHVRGASVAHRTVSVTVLLGGLLLRSPLSVRPNGGGQHVEASESAHPAKIAGSTPPCPKRKSAPSTMLSDATTSDTAA